MPQKLPRALVRACETFSSCSSEREILSEFERATGGRIPTDDQLRTWKHYGGQRMRDYLAYIEVLRFPRRERPVLAHATRRSETMGRRSHPAVLPALPSPPSLGVSELSGEPDEVKASDPEDQPGPVRIPPDSWEELTSDVLSCHPTSYLTALEETLGFASGADPQIVAWIRDKKQWGRDKEPMLDLPPNQRTSVPMPRIFMGN